MLYDLTIRNIVLIERLDLEFSKGLTVLSGETGAGKSVLLDSLGLALGARSDTGLIRQTAEEASVSASFDIPKTHPACALLADNDIEILDRLYIRRKLTPDGRSRALVNDQSVTVNFLKTLGAELVEVQGQFDQHRLLNSGFHLTLLDNFAGIDKTALTQTHQQHQHCQKEYQRQKNLAEQAAQDRDFIQHSIAELDALKPEPHEAAELAAERDLLKNAAQIGSAFTQCEQLLASPEGSIANLQSAIRLTDNITVADPRLQQMRSSLNNALIEMQDAQQNLSHITDTLDADPQKLQEIDDRLFALKDIARKHRIAPEALPDFLNELREKAALIDDGESLLADWHKQCETAWQNYQNEALAVREQRRQAAQQLRQAVMAELPPLKMPQAEFTVTLTEKPQEQWNQDGGDDVTFTLQTNPGQAAGPVHKIASGGELSRVLLALNLVFSKTRAMAVLLFDEVDSGVGGETASAIGKRLKRLAQDRQVIVITHAPQIAALGDAHYHVSKSVQGDSTTSAVKILSAPERLEEIARMVSDGTVTNAARAAALKLLQGGDIETIDNG